MREHLDIPEALNGFVWRYRNPGYSNKQHRHAELELNLVTQGAGTYLLANRRYQIRRGDLVWLFPAQEHVLLELTADFEMWVAVFRRKAVRRVGDDPAAKVLLAADFDEACCRRLSMVEHRRLDGALAELAAETGHAAMFNAGLSYVLLQAWKVLRRGCGGSGARCASGGRASGAVDLRRCGGDELWRRWRSERG